MTSIRQTINALIPSQPDRKLVAENKRLREALRKIASGTPDNLPPFHAFGPDQMKRIAREALKEPDDV